MADTQRAESGDETRWDCVGPTRCRAAGWWRARTARSPSSGQRCSPRAETPSTRRSRCRAGRRSRCRRCVAWAGTPSRSRTAPRSAATSRCRAAALVPTAGHRLLPRPGAFRGADPRAPVGGGSRPVSCVEALVFLASRLLEELLEPAAALAEGGLALTRANVAHLLEGEALLREDATTTTTVLPGGRLGAFGTASSKRASPRPGAGSRPTRVRSTRVRSRRSASSCCAAGCAVLRRGVGRAARARRRAPHRPLRRPSARRDGVADPGYMVLQQAAMLDGRFGALPFLPSRGRCSPRARHGALSRGALDRSAATATRRPGFSGPRKRREAARCSRRRAGFGPAGETRRRSTASTPQATR